LQSRRDFLKVTAATALTATLAYRRPVYAADKNHEPVLILGGGAAGLAAGHHFLKAGVPFTILEASSRLGGRILTERNFGAEGQFIERGAEFIDTSHQTMIDLAKEMGLTVERCDVDDKGLHATVCVHQGQFYYDADLIAGLKPLLQDIDRAIQQGARELTYDDPGDAHSQKWDKMTLQEYLDSTSGTVSAWVREIVRVAYVAEFGREAAEQSALNLILLMSETPRRNDGLFGQSDETMRIRGGNSGLPDALAANISGKLPGAIQLDTKVVAIAKRGQSFVVTVDQNGKTQELTAPFVICTLPFTVLRQVAGLDSLGLSKAKLACIRQLEYGYNSKTMTEFTEKVWRQTGSALPANAGSFYGDFSSQSFWESSKMQTGNHGVLTCFQGGAAGGKAGDKNEAQILADLEKLMPGLSARFVRSSTQNWTEVATAGGSYACLLAGQYAQINGAQRSAELGGRFQFAGEHISDEYQGYMNGAFETGLHAALVISKAIASDAVVI